MSHSIGQMLIDGQSYMRIWPMQRELYAIFPECRVIAATKFAIKVMPPLAILSVILLVNTFGYDYLPQAIAMAALVLSLPMQGLLWLGHRSNQSLSPSMRTWYQDIHQKMRTQGCSVQAIKARPKYKELAHLLNTAFDELDRVFTQQWF